MAFSSFIYGGLRRLQTGFARPQARAIFLALEVGSAAAVLVAVTVAHSVVLLAGGLIVGLLASLTVPRLIDLTGGMQPIRGLGQATLELEAFESRSHENPLSPDDRAWLERHLAGIERWRSPVTSPFIDLYRETNLLKYSVEVGDAASLQRLQLRLVEEARRIWPTKRFSV